MNINILIACIYINNRHMAGRRGCRDLNGERKPCCCSGAEESTFPREEHFLKDCPQGSAVNAAADIPPEKTEEKKKENIKTKKRSVYFENGHGLLHYRKWWERNEVEISVGGKIIIGTPIFAEENTLRVINNNFSYFVPLEKIDYIRTGDGLLSSFDLSDGMT